MNHTLPTHARTLPLYLAGVAAGQDIGLRLALDVICAELTRQTDAAIVAALDDPHGPSAASHECCAGHLLAVGQLVAGPFRRR